MRWEMAVEADAEVTPGTPADRKLAAVKTLCRAQRAAPTLSAADLADEILKTIEAEES